MTGIVHYFISIGGLLIQLLNFGKIKVKPWPVEYIKQPYKLHLWKLFQKDSTSENSDDSRNSVI